MGSESLAAAQPTARPDRDDNTPPARRAEGLKLPHYLSGGEPTKV